MNLAAGGYRGSKIARCRERARARSVALGGVVGVLTGCAGAARQALASPSSPLGDGSQRRAYGPWQPPRPRLRFQP